MWSLFWWADLEERINIGRELVLYNDYIPPVSNDTPIQALWKAFGYYDDIRIGENVFAQETKIRNMWRKTEEHYGELEAKNTSQSIWIFRTEESQYKDEWFWEKAKEGTEFPFLFISLIQVDRGEKGLAGWNERDRFEEKIESRHPGQIHAITYMTMDHSDMVLVVIANRYEYGAQIAEDIRKKNDSPLEIMQWKSGYNYTVAAVNRVFLNDKFLTDTLDGIVPDTGIYLIEKEPGSLDQMSSYIDEIKKTGAKVYRSTLLGCNDELLLLQNWEWADFLELYRDGVGSLNHTSQVFKDTCIGITTIIHHSKEIPGSKKEESSTDSIGQERTQKVIDLYRDAASKETDPRFKTLSQHMIKILNSLGKFEASQLNDYLFYPSLHQIEMILAIWNDLESRKRDRHTDKRRSCYFESAFEFIREFNLCMQNEVRPERQFTQVPDFDIKIYDTPIKLNVFYNAFIYSLKSFLNLTPAGDNHTYEFLAYPGITEIVKVREEFKGISDDKRLFLMELPERTSYWPRGIELVLGHEISHFVGGNIRNRKKRKEITARLIPEIFITGLCVKAYHELNGIFGGEWEDKADLIMDCVGIYELYGKIAKELEKYLDKVAGQEGYPGERIELLTTEGMVTLANKEGRKTIADIAEAVFTNIMQETGDERKAEKNRAGLSNALECYIFMTTRYVAANRNNNIRNIVEILFYLFRECLSDIICIYILEVGFDKYIKTILGELKQQNDDHIEEDNLFRLRMSLVYIALSDDLEARKFIRKEHLGAESDDTAGIIVEAQKIRELYYCEQNSEQYVMETAKDIYNYAKDGKTEPIEYFESRNAVTAILEYLKDCMSELKKQFSGKEADKYLTEVRTMYTLFEADEETLHIENSLLKMQEYIDQYMNRTEKEACDAFGSQDKADQKVSG